MKKISIIILTPFLFINLGFSNSGPIISGKITTTNSIPVNQAKISFVNVADTNRQFSSLSDSFGNYIITITGVESKDKEVTDFKLYQNYPNPFSEQTTITYTIKQQSSVVISIYNILGQRLKTFQQEYTGQNYGQVEWDGRDGLGRKVANGIYFYSVSIGDKRQVKKMLFIDNAFTEGIGSPIFKKNPHNYLEDIYQDSSNVYTVYIENTDSTKPKIEPVKFENVVIQSDTVLNFQVNEFKLPQWPMARYDASGRGQQFGYPYTDGLKDTTIDIIFRRDFVGKVGKVSIGPEGNIYVGVRAPSDTLLYAFDKDGNLLWTINGIGRAKLGVGIAVKDDGTVIITTNTYSGKLTAAYTSNGEQLWRINIGATRSLPAISKEGIIYFTSYEGILYAINSYTGNILWEKDSAFGESSPAISRDGTIYYFNSRSKELISLTNHGIEKWRYTDSIGVFAAYLVIDKEENIFFSNELSGGSLLYCIDKNGNLMWRKPKYNGDYTFDHPAVTPKGNIVAVSYYSVFLYNPNGFLIWEIKMPYMIHSNPIVDKYGNIYLGGYGLDNEYRGPDFYRISESGKIDIEFGNYIYSVHGIRPLLDQDYLCYFGGFSIMVVK